MPQRSLSAATGAATGDFRHWTPSLLSSYAIWLRLVVWLIKGNGNLAELGPAAEKAPTSHHHRFELERSIVKVLRLSELNAETAVCADLARNLQVQVLKFILVVLNIGYDLGILSGRIFAIMVLTAIFTTGMTRPLLTLIEYVSGKEAEKERSATIA